MTIYKAPVEDVTFLLNDVFQIDRYNNLPGFSDATADAYESVRVVSRPGFVVIWRSEISSEVSRAMAAAARSATRRPMCARRFSTKRPSSPRRCCSR